jgi:hypothetical protein
MDISMWKISQKSKLFNYVLTIIPTDSWFEIIKLSIYKKVFYALEMKIFFANDWKCTNIAIQEISS